MGLCFIKQFSLTPNLEYFTPTFCKVSIESIVKVQLSLDSDFIAYFGIQLIPFNFGNKS